MRIWLEKQRHFIDFTLSSLLRRKWKNGALLAVYTLVIFMVASVLFFTYAIRREAKSILAEAPEMIVQRTVAGRHDLIPIDYADAIKTIQGVRAVKPRLWGYYFHPASRSNYTIMVADDFPHEDGMIEVGQGVVRTWGTIEADQLYLRAYNGEVVSLKIAKLFSGSSELVSADLIITSESAFRRLTGMSEGFATDLAVEIRNLKECSTIAKKIVTRLPDSRPILKEEILRTYGALFDWRGGYIIVMLAGAVLAFFIFAWDKATGLSAEEKTEIGILKALGWDTSDILLMKFWEGSAVSLTAFLLGAIGAYLHVFFASGSLFEHALKGWSVLYPAFNLNPAVDIYALANLFFLTVLPYTLITMIPSWKVAVTDPDTVMR